MTHIVEARIERWNSAGKTALTSYGTDLADARYHARQMIDSGFHDVVVVVYTSSLPAGQGANQWHLDHQTLAALPPLKVGKVRWKQRGMDWLVIQIPPRTIAGRQLSGLDVWVSQDTVYYEYLDQNGTTYRISSTDSEGNHLATTSRPDLRSTP